MSSELVASVDVVATLVVAVADLEVEIWEILDTVVDFADIRDVVVVVVVARDFVNVVGVIVIFDELVMDDDEELVISNGHKRLIGGSHAHWPPVFMQLGELAMSYKNIDDQ